MTQVSGCELYLLLEMLQPTLPLREAYWYPQSVLVFLSDLPPAILLIFFFPLRLACHDSYHFRFLIPSTVRRGMAEAIRFYISLKKFFEGWADTLAGDGRNSWEQRGGNVGWRSTLPHYQINLLDTIEVPIVEVCATALRPIRIFFQR